MNQAFGDAIVHSISWHSASAGAALIAVALPLAGCTGDKFSACESCAGSAGDGGEAGTGGGEAGASGSAGNASGGTATGGGGMGGTGGSGGTTGGTGGSGGTDGSGGATDGSAGSSGSGMVDGGERFPRTPVLDNFNRADGPLSASWIGSRSSYRVMNQTLSYVSGACSPILWDSWFGVEQEVFATLSAVNNQAAEINLVFKAQDLVECELIELLYSPERNQIEIHYCTGGAWTELNGIPATLAPGDRLGARFYANARVHIYLNGVRAAIVDVSAYPHKSAGGRIGVNCVAPADGSTGWDDFGGG